MSLLSDFALVLHLDDNIAIAKQEIVAETKLTLVNGELLSVRENIPIAHKFALRAISLNEPVLRYGSCIGIATRPIAPGDWVHTHNVDVGKIDRAYSYTVVPTPPLQPAQQSFMGYARGDGCVGTRNYIAVIATVNCSAHVCAEIARAFTPDDLAAYPNVDGIIPIVHGYGCGTFPHDLNHIYLLRTIANVARNPNIGGCLFVSLGCESNEIGGYCNPGMVNLDVGAHAPYPIANTGMVIQDQGGFRKTVAAGIAAIKQMLSQVNACKRTRQPISSLKLALQCGGSDGWSGVTANPLVGMVVDAMVRQGGTAVLSETPEIFGAEHLLMQRVASVQVGEKLAARFQWWGEQAKRTGINVDNNPSPGNKKGGLTTIFEKSLGAVAKGGSTPLQAVYEYSERVTSSGFVFMDTPGNDPASATGQLAGGCNLILFTTGRGSLFGSNIAPCIKIATNSGLYARMTDDMDVNAGQILEGMPMTDAADELLDYIITVASGQKTKSEEKGLTDTEFVPWQPGPTV